MGKREAEGVRTREITISKMLVALKVEGGYKPRKVGSPQKLEKVKQQTLSQSLPKERSPADG